MVNGDSVAYRQISIDEEVTEEFVDSTNKRQYVKINGVKSYNFTKWVKNNNIAKLTPQDAVYENGEKIDNKGKSIADNLGWRQ